jgi:hypothetical protein
MAGPAVGSAQPGVVVEAASQVKNEAGDIVVLDNLGKSALISTLSIFQK